jgi:hypothetical protein
MNKRILRAFVAMGALATACASWGCVADRPSRNGVFNENQYIRKDFLIRPGTGGTDPGWFMKGTLVSTSTPNPFMVGNGNLFNGAEGTVNGFMPFVNFIVTSDKLQVANMREISANNPALNVLAQDAREQEIVNAWPITNVDLKYEINLDGEITNFFQENQEADWQQRQWVKVNFDKNDMSDLAPLGESVTTYVATCGDPTSISTTLVPGSFLVDETNNYMTWQVQITIPVLYNNQACVDSYGSTGTEFIQAGRTDVTMTLMYSFVRAASGGNASGYWDPTPIAQGGKGCSADLTCPATDTAYVPFSLAEKDPIQRKYGILGYIAWNRDPTTGLLAATNYVARVNPNAPMTLYLASGYPTEYEVIFCGTQADGFTPATNGAPTKDAPLKCGDSGTGGVVDQTNTLWTKAGAKAQMKIMHFDDDTVYGDHASSNPKQFGDVRYRFIRFITDFDSSPSGFLGITEPLSDPRTGENLTATIGIANYDIPDLIEARLEFYLDTIGGNGGTQQDNPYQINTNGDFAFTPKTGCSAATVGAMLPLTTSPSTTSVPADNSNGGAVQLNHNGISTVFAKMQGYLHKPLTTYGYLGPDDFVPQEDSDFFKIFYKILPYEVYSDPALNQYTVPEGGAGYYAPSNSSAAAMQAMSNQYAFDSFMQPLNNGAEPTITGPDGSPVKFNPENPAHVAEYTAQWQAASQAQHQNYSLKMQAQANPGLKMDSAVDVLSYFNRFQLEGRRCVETVANPAPHWESLAEWNADITLSTWQNVIWHEFGHSIGLDHNFMGSVDRFNFPTMCLGGFQNGKCTAANTVTAAYTSSIMEYSDFNGNRGGAQANPDGTAGVPLNPAWNLKVGWMPHDQAAIAFIYANALTTKTTAPNAAACTSSSCSVSGQIDATHPWNDPLGFGTNLASASAGLANNEIPFLWCSNQHVQYSPFCQEHDFGTTPSEIIAADLDEQEWQYKWRNFRLYRAFWDDSQYATRVGNFYYQEMRFLSTWAFDWNPSAIPELLVKLGVTPPTGVPEQDYFADIQNAFQNDISVANQLNAAYNLGIVQQASGERPYVTTYDPVYGDVTQQGIILDKLNAIQNFTTLYPVTNYDPTQSAGSYLFGATPLGADYQSVTENMLNNYVGGAYDIFLWAVPAAVSNFAQATQDLYFPGVGRASIRQWIGAVGLFGNGAAGIDPNPQFLAWAANLAEQYGFGCDADGNNCGPATCATAVGCPAGGIIACASPTEGGICTWDPRQQQTGPNDIYHANSFGEFRGPDARRYAFAFIHDRNQYLLVDRDTNTATYVIVRAWNTDVTDLQDDGSGGAYQLEQPMKYYLNAYNYYN